MNERVKKGIKGMGERNFELLENRGEKEKNVRVDGKRRGATEMKKKRDE